jgi:hypothetical protein
MFTSKKERLCNTVMHYATPHFNFWEVSHMLINFKCLQDVTVMPLYMTTLKEGCLVREHYSL